MTLSEDDPRSLVQYFELLAEIEANSSDTDSNSVATEV